ncbi:P1 family peptidase [uncultured Draconibacterium sp.]|uniref:DmpA family aminopeptidase n=1 Tax=uncultured Draconibacterium sp. TaxID=1573823 RepID=UPI002AA651D7|nr:P1 family peptidase [uncultured Draconibacterium sp.]
MLRFSLFFLLFLTVFSAFSQRLRDFDIKPGVMIPGALNAITDVEGVKVGHTTIVEGDNIRTGVTAIIPHPGNIFQEKVPAAIYIGNGFGKLAGYSQVEELGNIETPIVLTNTLSVPVACDALITYTLDQNKDVRSVNAVVGETNDGWLNDIRGRHVKQEHVLNAIESASSGPVEEGNVGAGTGTICFGFKGGIGTSSRVLPDELGGYTVGVLIQSNFGGVLKIDDFNAGEALGKFPFSESIRNQEDGSCMIVVATDAPLGSRNLKRMAKRAIMGLAKTGGIASNGSGDYVIAFSTAKENRVPYNVKNAEMELKELHNDKMSPLLLATIEATEEAILNSLLAAKTITGRDGHKIKALPIQKIIELRKNIER